LRFWLLGGCGGEGGREDQGEQERLEDAAGHGGRIRLRVIARRTCGGGRRGLRWRGRRCAWRASGLCRLRAQVGSTAPA
jgi:hypothetical protein